MARKQKQPLVPTQFKHLRFADGETGEILNFGGFTLAYRCTQQPSEIAGRPNIRVEYAYSECNISDNFNKADGRNRTYNRLQNHAPDYYEFFDLTPALPEGYEHHIIDLGNGIVDVSHKEFDLARYVAERFLSAWAAVLNVGTEDEGEGNLLNNLIVTEAGILAINSEVLSYVEPSFESVAHEVGTTVVGIADGALDLLDSINLDDSNATNTEIIAQVRKSLSDIKDLCSTMVAASTDEEEEESEEEEDEIDTDEDDGGAEDESDDEDDEEDDEDDEEGDDEEQ